MGVIRKLKTVGYGNKSEIQKNYKIRKSRKSKKVENQIRRKSEKVGNHKMKEI